MVKFFKKFGQKASSVAKFGIKVAKHPGFGLKKGQNIALVGSTGRSTGPHVHFEVYKNGRVVDPAAYIHRTAR